MVHRLVQRTEIQNSLYADQKTIHSLQNLQPYHVIKHMPVLHSVISVYLYPISYLQKMSWSSHVSHVLTCPRGWNGFQVCSLLSSCAPANTLRLLIVVLLCVPISCASPPKNVFKHIVFCDTCNSEMLIWSICDTRDIDSKCHFHIRLKDLPDVAGSFGRLFYLSD